MKNCLFVYSLSLSWDFCPWKVLKEVKAISAFSFEEKLTWLKRRFKGQMM